MRLGRIYGLFAGAAAVFVVIVAASIISHRGSHYNGRSLEEWFRSPQNQETIQAFQEAGTNSFPFLEQKLRSGGRFAACTVVEQSFKRSQIENSGIEREIRTMLKSGGQGEQVAAYSVIRKLGLNVPSSEIAAAAEKCPSIKASEQESSSQSKLPRLYSMTNSFDCAFIAKLCNDPDPQVQMLTFDFLEKAEKTRGDLCSSEMIPALRSLIQNRKNPSVLRAALGYISVKPERIRDNIDAVCALFEKTTDPGLQSMCASLLVALCRTEPLPAKARQTLVSLQSRSGIDIEVGREIKDLLANQSK